ncbi:MAG: trimeric intracellular cation channel family protein [Thermoflexibacter sp.]
MTLTYALELIGTFVFAISGALAAEEHELDAFGIAFIAFITALGGGTTRDVLLGIHPLVWIADTNYLLTIFVAVAVAIAFKKYILPLRKTFFLFDTIGIGFFTILGLKKALLVAQVSPLIGVIMGMVSATFGGVLRDVFCNQVPLIFRKEIYATACLVGAGIYLFLEKISPYTRLNTLLTIFVIIIIRFVAVKYKLSLTWKR